MSELENPFQETLLSRHRAEPCTVVIFGATGDLTHRKLIPAFYNIAAECDLPPQFKVVGFARRDKTKSFALNWKLATARTAAKATMTSCGRASPRAFTTTAASLKTWRATSPWAVCWTSLMRSVEHLPTGSFTWRRRQRPSSPSWR